MSSKSCNCWPEPAIRSPRVDLLAVDDSPLDQPLVVLERIDGQILGQLVERASGAERESLLRRFCQLLARLHQLDWRPFVADPEQYRAADAVHRWLDQTEAYARRLNVHEFEPAFLWLRERATRVQTGQLAIAHWDFHPWNVLVRSDGAAFVIDWTGGEITDSRFDLGWTLLLLRSTLGPTARDAVLAEYERNIGGPTADLDFFEAAASLRRTASIDISLTAGAEKLGMRPGAEAQMKTDSSHLSTAYALLRERTGLTIPAVENLLSG
jgi:aminoglycoside phosphotransferase (APT) family kinase protein